MDSETWQRLLSLETRDVVSAWHKAITSRELNERRIKEVISSAKQAREFFRNAERADISVKPLLSFYGVASLSRATLLLLKRASGEASLTNGHGLEAVGWANTLSGDISTGLRAIPDLKIRTRSGLFSEFVKETNNRICIYINSSQVGWHLDYTILDSSDELTLGDLMSRLPDLQNDHKRSLSEANYAHVDELTFTHEEGFAAKVNAEKFTSFQDTYLELGFTSSQLGNWTEIRASKEVFASQLPQFMHAHVNKTFSIPSLYIVKLFASGSRYSQLAITYMLSYYLGMLARYFPTHWAALSSGDKGDGIWPAINSIQKYIDSSFPEMIVEFIHHTLDKAEAPEG